MLTGTILAVEAVVSHVPKGATSILRYYSLDVETINMKMKKSKNPVTLNKRIEE